MHGGRMRCQVGAKPQFLSRFAAAGCVVVAGGVEDDDVPGAEVVAVVGAARIACARAEEREGGGEIARCSQQASRLGRHRSHASRPTVVSALSHHPRSGRSTRRIAAPFRPDRCCLRGWRQPRSGSLRATRPSPCHRSRCTRRCRLRPRATCQVTARERSRRRCLPS